MPATTFLLAQITDLHLKSPDIALFGALDPESSLDATIACLKGLPQRPDLLLITGDLTNDGEEPAYRRLERKLDDIGMPWLAIPGNHDTAKGFPVAGGDTTRSGPKLAWRFDHPDMTLFGLDSLVEGQSSGTIGDAQLAWLNDELNATDDKPVVIAVHHPPFRTRIRGMDGIGLDDADALARIVRHRSNLKAILSGHVHRTVIQQWQGVMAITAPSPVNAVAFSLDPDADAVWRAEPPAFMLHELTDDGQFTSHVIPIGDHFTEGSFFSEHTERQR